MESSNIILPENLFAIAKIAREDIRAEADIPDGGIDLNATVESFERNIIEKALQRTRGSKSKAAELLRVSLDSLRYRIDKLNIT